MHGDLMLSFLTVSAAAWQPTARPLGARRCATPSASTAWASLEERASLVHGFALRQGLVPSTAPHETVSPTLHTDVPTERLVLYRDTNAWCPFCERVWLYLIEAGVEHDTAFIDLRAKPEWYKDMVPTGQTPSIALGGRPVWESIEIMEQIEATLDADSSLLPPAEADRTRVLEELRNFDSAEHGIGIGAAGYTYMRGAPFGAQPEEGGPSLDELRAAFLDRLGVLEARLSKTCAAVRCRRCTRRQPLCMLPELWPP